MKRTPLYNMHIQAGAKMVPFAGYEMPVQYEGIIKEHTHTREAVSLFDVSHMGQIEISGPYVQSELEQLIPIDLDRISLSHMAYAVMTNSQGGVIDDLIITRRNRDNFLLVVNAGCKDKVVQHLSRELEHSPIHLLNDYALLAVQGPMALPVMLKIFPEEIADLGFMEGMLVKHEQVECFVSRSGYTGEDGFELSVPERHAETLAKDLLSLPSVKWAGLGARDSLRTEAGLCLYGHELNEEITPVQAGLSWTISPSRQAGGDKEGNFPGAEKILSELSQSPHRQRIGLTVKGKIPVRQGATVCAKGQAVGEVTSGTFSPVLDCPIAMAMIDANCQEKRFTVNVRGKEIEVERCALPFVPHRYANTK